jgi:ADP-ribose pyrophosphatase
MAYRPGIRVPAYFRKELALTVPDRRENLPLPEAVAGSLEPQDVGLEGFLARVAAEVAEETGFGVRPEEIEPLGGGFFPSHGQSSEKIHLCAVRVVPGAQGAAEGDGSVNEADAPPAVFAPVREILLACARGEIEDPKVEILAWRLCLKLRYDPVLDRILSEEEAAAFRAALTEGGWDAAPPERRKEACHGDTESTEKK